MTLAGAVPREKRKVLNDKNGKTGLGSNVDNSAPKNVSVDRVEQNRTKCVRLDPELACMKNTASKENVEYRLTNDVSGSCPKRKSPDGQKRKDRSRILSHRSPHLGFQLATLGGGLIRRAALIFRGTTKLGATVPEPYT